MSFFEILGKIENEEQIARGRGIRSLRRLRRTYGGKNWRKMRGIARVRLGNGRERNAELHWYYGHGVGQREFKIKRFLP